MVELLSSMRFAIALLTVICIASVIGTIVVQHQPAVNYVDQFGPFWAELFLKLNLNAIYSAWWFLLILAFLVVSTSLCIARHAPKMLRDMRTYKENIRERNLKAFHYKAHNAWSAESPLDSALRIQKQLSHTGWGVRVQERQLADGQKGYMVAAKRGGMRKIGYIAAHSAIVLVCLGGLFDGQLFVRGLGWFGGKSVYTGGGFISEVSAEHRLPPSNPSFRGDLLVPEGQASGTAILSQSDGVFLQELPFVVELKKFDIEFFSTGEPSLFASDIVIHDRIDGTATPARVEVNHPVGHRGIQIYQSGFDDGGSRVTLKAWPMRGQGDAFEVSGRIGESTQLNNADEQYTLEYSELRLMNVEDMGAPMSAQAGMEGSAVDVRKVNLGQSLSARLGAADKTSNPRNLKNVGPSITYQLRDASGQAREYVNYMLPVDMGDGIPMFLLGVSGNEGGMRYLRVPADDERQITGFMQLQSALHNPDMRQQAVARYVEKTMGAEQTSERQRLAEQLALSSGRLMDLFAGNLDAQDSQRSGLQAVSDFIEATVPENERERAAEVILRTLGGTLVELNALVRERAGRAALPVDDAATHDFMTQSMLALSDAMHYPAPLAFELNDFEHVQASVFQVTRAPGKKVVYLGCLLLILGVFGMLYVRERRLWVWLKPEDGQTSAQMAMSLNRKVLDADGEFEQLKHEVLGLPEQGQEKG